MKTMTCAQLGGPCDLQLRGETADEVIQAQDRHLGEAVAAGDTTHADAQAEMKARWQNPEAGMGWYQATQQAFADLPEDD